jgi:molybdopterin-containing oxidoreductase family iron-sulfur binding subunit
LEEHAHGGGFPEGVEREFPPTATGPRDSVSRRQFVRLMSASFLLAGAGLTGCRRPEERIHPFAKSPEGYVHGAAQYYATAMPTRGTAIPLLVKTHEGRPVKIEGNPEHPICRSPRSPGSAFAHAGTDAAAQAAILGLYDPDRAQRCLHRGQTVRVQEAFDQLARVAERHGAKAGKGLHLLMERSGSPSRARLQEEIGRRWPLACWYVDEPLDDQLPRRAATLAYKQPLAQLHRLDRAKRILSLEADFLGTEPEAWRLTRGFALSRALRQPKDAPSRLYAVESLFSLTGANAEHRLRLPATGILPFACHLLAEVIRLTGAARSPEQAAAFDRFVQKLGATPPFEPAWLRECAKDLVVSAPDAVILAGQGQPLAVHVIALALNHHLGAIGKAVELRPWPEPPAGSFAELGKALEAGEVETLILLGGNPAYHAPAALDWGAVARKAGSVIRWAPYEDETTPHCQWQLPATHFLEAWGDTRTADGTWTPIQPLIQPLFGGVTELELLARCGGLATTHPHEIVRDTFRAQLPPAAFEECWKQSLHDGFLPSAEASATPPDLDWRILSEFLQTIPPMTQPDAQHLDVVFHRDGRVDDGRYANNGWLQELPDPITKVAWDNVILLSERTARELGFPPLSETSRRPEAPVGRLSLGGISVEGPVWIQPGMADYVAGLALGQGRTAAGRVGNGVGFNACRLRPERGAFSASGATLILTGRTQPVACTQNHWRIEGRPLIREADLDTYRKRPHFAREQERPRSANSGPLYRNPLDAAAEAAQHRWGMAIDLQACVGCSACMMACQSENNVPVVGREQVALHREMHWLRVDRYYRGEAANPRMLLQPMLCQHCEAAPCENVCPVNATVHDEEGLNLMAYNRCVGTRYCSNNCPYKVRRFNFFDYNRRPLDRLHDGPLTSATDGEWDLWRWFKAPDRGGKPQDEWDLLKLARNPEVTVRMRGVMEKCTFCVQRISAAKIARKVSAGASRDFEVPDAAIQTACQQACPAEAIVFGNLNDLQSTVSLAQESDRKYFVLESLGVKPRIAYLARVWNPNRTMPDYTPTPAGVAVASASREGAC